MVDIGTQKERPLAKYARLVLPPEVSWLYLVQHARRTGDPLHTFLASRRVYSKAVCVIHRKTVRWLVQTACELRLIVATATHPAAKFSTCDHVERERESVLVCERDI